MESKGDFKMTITELNLTKKEYGVLLMYGEVIHNKQSAENYHIKTPVAEIMEKVTSK